MNHLRFVAVPALARGHRLDRLLDQSVGVGASAFAAQGGGAQVVRQLLTAPDHAAGPDYAARAAIPSDILYDPANGNLAFSTAGPIHALLFAFGAGPHALEGSWASSRAPGAPYRPIAGRVVLRRCG